MLKSDNQTLVLNEFLRAKSSDVGLQLRELGRKVNLAPTSVKKYLEELEREGIIKKKIEEKYPRYYPNNTNKQYLRLKSLYIIRLVHENGMIEHIERAMRPSSIVLGGLNFEEEPSEIKLFIRGKAEHLKLEEYEKGINIKIMPITYKEDHELSHEHKEQIINGIVIKGKLELIKREVPVEIEAPRPSEIYEEGYYNQTLIKKPGILGLNSIK